ncbi:EscU/YscU/HrcU family type III secretion system export apparatus switch protein [Cupriavidus basilensis]|uniref:Flagellar biosynthesis protein FlhB n=1 Tax=Cupriavidus basilensis TaxID=68895 RepID=A0A0C4YGW6_9BURK|nr:EscU/YscU/HrcU family type III secretion system export apparatus switch protein [Cupriavidus basilensis]AJG22178.1 Flagellar biosynthesis protein FlhB [Cupriavidus basilensis]
MRQPDDNARGTAVALSYDETRDQSPRVVAKGYGDVADAIIARARDSGVYVHNSPALVTLLMQVDLDSRIPEQLYVAVAELLAWLYQLEKGEAQAGSAPASNTFSPR